MKIVVEYDTGDLSIVRVSVTDGDTAPEFEEVGVGNDTLDVPTPEIWAETFKLEDDIGTAIVESCIVNEAETDIELI